MPWLPAIHPGPQRILHGSYPGQLVAFSVETSPPFQKLYQPHAEAVALAIIDEGHGADLPNLARNDMWSTPERVLNCKWAFFADQWVVRFRPNPDIGPGQMTA